MEEYYLSLSSNIIVIIITTITITIITTNLAKQEAYQLWRRNRSDIIWNNYVNLRNAAQETYATAEKEYNDGVRDTLIGTTNSHKWWSTLKTALFGVDVVVPPILRPDGSLVHYPKEKAALFADVFDSKQSNDSLTMPQSCFPVAELTTIAFSSGEVKKLLLNLTLMVVLGLMAFFLCSSLKLPII